VPVDEKHRKEAAHRVESGTVSFVLPREEKRTPFLPARIEPSSYSAGNDAVENARLLPIKTRGLLDRGIFQKILNFNCASDVY
jgi:hypothetical protein